RKTVASRVCQNSYTTTLVNNFGGVFECGPRGAHIRRTPNLKKTIKGMLRVTDLFVLNQPLGKVWPAGRFAACNIAHRFINIFKPRGPFELLSHFYRTLSASILLTHH